jgi:RNA polymerase primary sigma factor
MPSNRKQFFNALFSKSTMRKMYPHRDAALRAYLRDLGPLPLLTAEQEAQLLRRTSQGDVEARQRLIEANLRLVIVIAARFQGRGLSMMDLIQEGNLGLLESIQRFDFTKSNSARLSTYATYRIFHAIGRAVAERGKIIHTPYSTAQRMQEIEKVVWEFVEQGVEPTTKSIAERVSLTVEQVAELLALMQEPLSLYQEDEEHDSLSDVIVAPPLLLSNEVATPSLLADVAQMISSVLSADELRVIEHRYGLTDEGIIYDYHEIAAKVYGRTGKRADERIRQLERSGLAKLRAAFDREEA